MLGLLALLLGGGAEIAPPTVIDSPIWAQSATREDRGQRFPDTAYRFGVTGQATVQCRVEVGGALTACEVLEETPANWGFGGATLRIASRYRLQTTDGDGNLTPGRYVRLPVKWIAPMTVPLLCTDAPAPMRVCEVDLKKAKNYTIWRSADVLAIEMVRDMEPPADVERIRDGRFRWWVTLPMPLQECPTLNGEPKCDGATKFLPLLQ